MSEGLSHVAIVFLVAAFIVEGAGAAEGLYFVAAGEQVMLMLQHNDALLGFDVCFLVHCFVSFWGRCAQNYQKIYFKNYKNSRWGEAFDNFLIQFSYNFEAAGRPLFFLGSLRSKFSKNLFQKL